MTQRVRFRPPGPLLTILAIGAASLTLYLVTVVLEREIFLNGLDLTAAGVHVEGTPRDPDRLLRDLVAYELVAGILFALYVGVLLLAGRGHLTGHARIAAVALPVVFHLSLLPMRPYLSLDVFTYLAFGAQQVILGTNPYAAPAIELAGTPYGRELVSLGWRPTVPVTPYGPLLTALQIGVVSVSRDVATGVLLSKALVVAASLGSGALVWAILGRVRPADQLLGTLAYLWSPLVVVELAAEGHNEALVILFVLAGLYFAVRIRAGPAVVALALAVLMKAFPVILALPQAVFLWRDREGRGSRTRGALAGLAASLGVAVILFAPFWIGQRTFAGISAIAEVNSAFASMRWALLAVWDGAGEDATRMATAVVVTVFAAVVIVASTRVRDAASMLRSCAWVSLAYVLIATPYFWPWHAALPVTLMALSPSGAFRWMIVVLAAAARAVAPLDDMFANEFIPVSAHATLTFMIAIAVPLAVLLGLSLRTRLGWAAGTV